MGRLAQTLHLGVCGELRIALDHAPRRMPGDTLRGNVHMHVYKAVEQATLVVKIRGAENLRWLTNEGQGWRSHFKYCVLLEHEILLDDADRAFDIDEYSYPFELALPLDLPPNFKYTGGQAQELHGICVDVVYTATATLRVKGLTKANLDHQCVFTLSPLPTAVPLGKPVAMTHKQPVRLLGMVNTGECEMHVAMDTDVLDSASTIIVRMALDVSAKQRLRCIRVVLYEDVSVNRRRDHWNAIRTGSRVVCRRRFDRATIGSLTRSSTGVCSETGADADRTLTLHLPVTPNDVAGFDALNPTMTTLFITIGYRVAVECSFTLCARVRASFPVTLVRTQAAATELVAEYAVAHVVAA